MNNNPWKRICRPLLLLVSIVILFALGILWQPVTFVQAEGSIATPQITVETFVAPITFPVAMDIAPDGRVFVAERFVGTQTPITGTIRVIAPDGMLQPTPFVTVTLADSTPYAEKGLLGVALDPDFAENGYVYAYRTAQPDQANADDHGEILRFTAVTSGTAVIASDMIVLVDDLPAQTCCHNGGTLRFGPDGKLYLSIGDNHDANSAQDLSVRTGKLLRFNRDGSIPADNPFVDEPTADDAVYAYGLRNVFGYDWHPSDGDLYASENGPGCNDELNRIVPGGNYGWPLSEEDGSCVDPGPDYIAPVWTLDPPDGLTGVAFAPGPLYRNLLMVGSWNSGSIYWIPLSGAGSVTAVETLLENCGQPGGDHNLLDIVRASDTTAYFSCQQEIFPAPADTGAIYRMTFDVSQTYAPFVFR